MHESIDDYSRDLSLLEKSADLGDKVSQYESELSRIETRQATLPIGSPQWKKVERARIIAAAKLQHYRYAWFSLTTGELVGTEYNNKPLTAESPPEDFIAMESDLSEQRYGIRVMDSNSVTFVGKYVRETSNNCQTANKTGTMKAAVILKLLTCTVWGAIAGLVLNFVYDPHARDDVLVGSILIGSAFGLFLGISWAIRQKKVRAAFVAPAVTGMFWCLIGMSIQSVLLMYVAIPAGLFVGIVWALAYARAFTD